jgi:hypothetical protein
MMNLTNYILIMGLFSSLFGCGDDNRMNKDLIEINSRTEEDFHDFVFTIVDSKLTANGEYELTAKGKNKEEIVGLKIKIKNKLKAGFVGSEVDNTAFELNGATFYSIGLESDNLIRGISNLYAFPTDNKFTNDISFDIFSLNQQQADLSKDYYKFKLFLDPNDELGLYSELYLNVNLPNNEIELREKDPEYRENLVKAMTKD